MSAEFEGASVVSKVNIRRQGNELTISHVRPAAALPFNTLLVLYPGKPTSFATVSRNWLGLQKYIQTLYQSRATDKDIYKEALAQKLTRVGCEGNVHSHWTINESLSNNE